MTLTQSLATGPSEPPLQNLTIGDLLRRAAATAPDRVALIEGIPEPSARRQWTYEQLLEESELVARGLLARFEPGSRIAVWAQNLPEWVILEFGIALAGMVIVTVNPAYQAAELRYVLTQSQASGLVCVDSYRGNPMLEIATTVHPDCPDLQEILRLADWDDLIASGKKDSANDTMTDLPLVQPSDAVMIQYTSGTTGFPKGALLHHRGLVNNAAHYLDRLGIDDGDVIVGPMPLFHTAGSAMTVLGCASLRCTHVLVETFDPGIVLDLLETYGSNAMLGVPTMLIAMLENERFERTDLTTLKGLCSGGSLVPEHLVRTFEERLGAPFTIVYGQTECSPVATMTAPDDSMAQKATTIGAPMPHCEIRIIDVETGETLPVGEVGELVTRGYHVMHGYFDMPEQTAEAIDNDDWLHTGDLGAMDDAGYCSIEGRLKDMIIRGGENVYPKEIEELLYAHASVGEVAVVGLPDEKWGESVAAFIRPAPGSSVNKAELFNYLREHLAAHKTPRQWFETADFPLTGSGKIQKFKLREQWAEGEWTEI